MVIAVAGMGWIVYAKGFPQRFNPIQRILFAHQVRSAQQAGGYDPCFVAEDRDSRSLGEECKINARQPNAILGDSHASALWHGIHHNYFPLAKYSASGCAPLLGDEIVDWRPFCPAVNAFNFKEIAAKQPPLLILHANWLLYSQKLPQDDPQLIGKQLQNTLAHLRQIAPHTQVVVVGDVPQWPPSLVQILSDYAKTGMPDARLANSSYAELKEVEQILLSHMDEHATFISLLDALCTSDGECTALVSSDTDWEPLVWDYGHLGTGGSKYVADWLFSQPTPLSLGLLTKEN